MHRFVNRFAALAALAAAGLVGGGALAEGYGVATPGCDPQPWSYGAVIERSRPGGSYGVGPQRFCVEVVEERRVPLGPIGIVIDPFGDRTPAPPLPAPPGPLRAPTAPHLSRR